MLDYSSSDGEDDKKQIKQLEQPQKKKKMLLSYNILDKKSLVPQININPNADITALVEQQKEQELQWYKEQNPEEFEDKSDNHVTGYVKPDQKGEILQENFDDNQRNFTTYGFAYDPNSEQQNIIINQNIHPELYEKVKKGYILSESDIVDMKLRAYGIQKQQDKEITKKLKEKREKYGDAGSETFQGPWAKYNDEQIVNIVKTKEDDDKIKDIEDKRKEQKEEEVKIQNEYQKKERQVTEFFLDSAKDYKGQSYLKPPPELKPHEHNCFIPKKCVRVWKDHTDKVQCIRFFPKYGHYLLSASFDNTCKLFSTIGDRKLTRSYNGHKQAVRDIDFASDGKHFLSASFDKTLLYWDTEYGKIVQKFQIKAYPYNVKIHPDINKQHSFLLGSSNKKIMQFDFRSGNRTQVYDEHLGQINTITFYNNNRHFVSTSDDKKMFCWEFGIPIVIKHFAEPDQHSVHATTVSPNQQYMTAQQANNKIAVYDLKGGNLRLNRKKIFEGHKSAGYSIGMTVSDDGKYMASGDSEGRAFFWDWKTGKNYRALDAHTDVCMDVKWHPIETSKVATCGWDGLIKYWD
ncbi:WD40-repeat-containing domain [Pseudocohnilembus persalinus]|uniref:Pre-mRNA-processing factor 17 n=1 Tax=Pseudocohnilembus persalinus TaxID=266149 RepID=A0A0V0QYR4_PSEPJ|nr:WD40-repeat-containing domain [Pseudocohnilembus persalinus]|eukprot:KRX07313.1 WD40-repeat-containing domain [Pseudocohnilembus persalinus]